MHKTFPASAYFKHIGLKFSICILPLALLLSCSPFFSPLHYSSEEGPDGGKPNSDTAILNELGIAHDQNLTFEKVFERVGCTDFRSLLWDYIYKVANMKEGKLPPYQYVKDKITKQMHIILKAKARTLPSKHVIDNFASYFVHIYGLVVELVQNNPNINSELVRLEYQIIDEESSPSTSINDLEQTLDQLEKYAKQLNMNCPARMDPHVYPTWGGAAWLNQMKHSLHPLVYGALKVMAVAYQSCAVLDLPLMPFGYKLRGVKKTTRHDRRGWKRAITNVNLVKNTHYYISQTNIANPQACFNVSRSPLLFDYGGKPNVDSPYSINIFKNNKSSARLLGLDCSGFIASAIAVGGLRLKQNVPFKPSHTLGINVSMLRRAQRNGLSCLSKQDLSPANPLMPGDIIASRSHHSIIVESASQDPFGISHIQSPSLCAYQKIKTSRFQFSIIQSSVHNNGVGINRMHITEAKKEIPSITKGLKQWASRVCYKKFGLNKYPHINHISIQRHKGTNGCFNREIRMVGQDCMSHCSPNRRFF